METTIVRFLHDKKRANVVMWKDKEYKYFRSAENKQLGVHHSSLAKRHLKRMLNNRVRCGNRPIHQHSI